MSTLRNKVSKQPSSIRPQLYGSTIVHFDAAACSDEQSTLYHDIKIVMSA